MLATKAYCRMEANDTMIVYVISNSVTGQVYVGQTAQTLEQRWRQHLYSAFHRNRGRSKSRLLSAIRKFGAQAFSIRKLWEDVNGSYDEMNRKEQGYIRAFDSTNPRFGYNIHPGWTPPNGGKHRIRKSDNRKVSDSATSTAATGQSTPNDLQPTG